MTVDAVDPKTMALQAATRVAAAAADVLRHFAEPGFPQAEATAALKPRPEDYARVFRADLADAVRAAYEQAWAADPPVIDMAPDQTMVQVFACPAGLLGEENELSRAFPGGYRAAAPYLVPERVWLAWRYAVPGTAKGMAYNGLVWVEDHWAFFPKPYRVIGTLIQ